MQSLWNNFVGEFFELQICPVAKKIMNTTTPVNPATVLFVLAPIVCMADGIKSEQHPFIQRLIVVRDTIGQNFCINDRAATSYKQKREYGKYFEVHLYQLFHDNMSVHHLIRNIQVLLIVIGNGCAINEYQPDGNH